MFRAYIMYVRAYVYVVRVKTHVFLCSVQGKRCILVINGYSDKYSRCNCQCLGSPDQRPGLISVLGFNTRKKN